MSKRLMRDLAAIKADNEWNFTATLDDNDMTKLVATFPGPSASPYNGGIFVVDFKVPPEYPLKPPAAKFRTRIFHPNISSQTGAICLDILKGEWTPVYNLESILISLQQLLDSPNPSDPQDAEVAGIYIKNPEEFKRTASEWTAKYATPEQPGVPGAGVSESSLAPFLEMGYSKSQVVEAMQKLGLSHVVTDEERNRVAETLMSS